MESLFSEKQGGETIVASPFCFYPVNCKGCKYERWTLAAMRCIPLLFQRFRLAKLRGFDGIDLALLKLCFPCEFVSSRLFVNNDFHNYVFRGVNCKGCKYERLRCAPCSYSAL